MFNGPVTGPTVAKGSVVVGAAVVILLVVVDSVSGFVVGISDVGSVAELGSTVVSPSSPSAITYFKFGVIFRRSLIMIHFVWYSLYQ